MKDGLNLELQFLLVNFNRVETLTNRAVRVFEPPINAQDESKITEMLAGDVARQFYAAVLLSKFDAPRSRQILNALTKTNSLIKVQTRTGHGVLEVPVRILAAGFLAENKIWSRDLDKIQNLANWASAVAHENRANGGNSKKETLPQFEELWTTRGDAARLPELRAKINALATKSAARKFYAAALLEEIDEAAARKIWKSLKKDKTPVLMMFSDVALAIPAKEIAAALLEKRAAKLNGQADLRNPKTQIGKVFRWLRQQIFSGSRSQKKV